MFKLLGIKKYIVLVLLLQLCSASYAYYDVYKAKTVSNKELIKKQPIDDNEYIPTYNDPDLPEFSSEDTLIDTIEEKTKNFIEKMKYEKIKNGNKNQDGQEEKNINEDEILPEELTNESIDETAEEIDDTSEVRRYKPRPEDNEVVDNANRFKINADSISYDDTEGNVYAYGNVEIISVAKGTTIKADEAILDKAEQKIKLFKNVKVIKEGSELAGDSLIVDLNEQNVLMDNPVLNAYSFNIVAQEGYIISNDIQMINGTIKSDRQNLLSFETRAFQAYENVATDYSRKRNVDRSSADRSVKQRYRVEAKEIVLTSYKDHNSLLLKKANVYYNNHRIVWNSDLEIISDKEKQVVETSAPELGNLRNFGMYLGYGYVQKLPKGQTLKIMPALVYSKDDFGLGIIGRHQSINNRLEAGWATPTSNLIVKGSYRLGKGLGLRYGRNTYLPEGFLGARRSGYALQLQHIQNFKVNGIDGLLYRQGIYAGIFSDYRKRKQESAYATTRFRYTGELRKNLFEYNNEEQEMSIRVSALAQGAATVYGSGHRMGIIRVGPYLTTRLKFWESSIAFMLSGIHGTTPFKFDRYRYGRETIQLNEQIHFSDKFALGYRTFLTPLKDNYNKEFMTESRFYAVVGPQDLKVVLSYDFVRDVAHCEFMFLLGTDSAHIDFERLITKNMDGANRKRDFYKYAKPVRIVDPEDM